MGAGKNEPLNEIPTLESGGKVTAPVFVTTEPHQPIRRQGYDRQTDKVHALSR